VKGSISRTGSEIRRTAAGLWSEGRGWILVTVAVGCALSIGVRFVYPTLVPFFQDEFQIGFASTGLLMAVLWGGYAVGHIPGGILGDRIGEGNVLVLSTAISAGAILVVATAVKVWMLFVGTVAFGLATALYGPTRFTILTDIYSKQSGSAIGLTMAAGNLGNTVFPAAAAFIATYLTWRFGFGVFVPLFGVVAVGLWVTVPGRTSAPTSAVDDLSVSTLKEVALGITHGSIPIIVAIQISISYIIQGFASFYPAYLIAMKGLSPSTAAILFGLFWALGAVIQPISGSMVGRVGTRNTLVASLSGCVLGLWLLPFFEGLVPLVAITALTSSWNGSTVVTQTYIADTLPSDMQGTGFGVLKASWMLVGATSPLAIGVLAEYGFFNEAFLLLAVVGTVGVLLSVVSLPDY
jgi:MFS family permease